MKVKLTIGFEEIQAAVREYLQARGVPATDLGALVFKRWAEYPGSWEPLPSQGPRRW